MKWDWEHRKRTLTRHGIIGPLFQYNLQSLGWTNRSFNLSSKYRKNYNLNMMSMQWISLSSSHNFCCCSSSSTTTTTLLLCEIVRLNEMLLKSFWSYSHHGTLLKWYRGCHRHFPLGIFMHLLNITFEINL